jgi:hypothetical protein
MEFALAGLCEKPCSQTLKRPFFKKSSTRHRVEETSKTVLETGGASTENHKTNKIKTNYYEKIFTFNFCCNAGGVQCAGRD